MKMEHHWGPSCPRSRWTQGRGQLSASVENPITSLPHLHQVFLLKGIPGDCSLTGSANPSTPAPKLDWVSNRITSYVTESVSFLSPGTPQRQAFCLCIPYIGT